MHRPVAGWVGGLYLDRGRRGRRRILRAMTLALVTAVAAAIAIAIVGLVLAVGRAVAVAVAVLAGAARPGLAMLVRARAHALAELLLAVGQLRLAGGDGLCGHAQGGRDLRVAVAVVVAQDKRRCLLRRQLLHGEKHVRVLRDRRRVRPWLRRAESSDYLARLADPLVAPIGDGDIDGDPVRPAFDGGIGPPALPAPVGAFEGLLGPDLI